MGGHLQEEKERLGEEQFGWRGRVLGTEAITPDWLFGRPAIHLNAFLEQTAGFTTPISSTEPRLAI